MRLDDLGDFIGVMNRQIMVAAFYDMQSRIGQQLKQALTHRKRADRVAIAPDQKRGSLDRGNFARQILPDFRDPFRGRWKRFTVIRPPVRAAEVFDRRAGGCRGQNEPPNFFRRLQRASHGDEAAHRLRNDVGSFVERVENHRNKIVGAAHIFRGRLVPKSRP